MARTAITRSISFDPELYLQMEDAREGVAMERSEFVKRCVINGIALAKKNPGALMSVPEGMQLTSHSSRTIEAIRAAKKVRTRQGKSGR